MKTKTRIKKKNIIDRQQTSLYLMCLIPILLLFIFNYLPMFGIVIAFKDYRFDKGIFGSDWVGFDNFKFLFRGEDFSRILYNTVTLNFIFIVVGIIAAVAVALVLFEVNSRKALKAYQTSIILPNFISWVVVGYMSYALLNPQYGVINSVFRKFGLEGVQWYSKPEYWPFILCFASTWKKFGIDSLIYYAALMGQNNEYFEAAEVDGASKFQITMRIKLPLLIPIISIMTILAIGNIFRADFGLFYQLTRDVGILYPTTDVIDTYVYRSLKVLGDIPMSSATSFLQSVVGFVVVIITNWISGKIDEENKLF